MKTLSGTNTSKEIKQELKAEIIKLKEQGINPTLAVVLVGNDPASQVYVNLKKKDCQQLGINSIEKHLSEKTSQQELVALIKQLNSDPQIHGIICQLPLPKQCNEAEIIELIDPKKDVDCFHPYNLGLLTAGTPHFMPCTPFGVCQILKRYQIETSGKNVVVVGRSNIVGRPLSILLSLKEWNATVTVCHSKSQNLAQICSNADILIAAIGKARFITKEFIRKGAIIIDVGTNKIDDKLVGDVDWEAACELAQAATPVPGGVGPMTRAMLMYNTVNAARQQHGLNLFRL